MKRATMIVMVSVLLVSPLLAYGGGGAYSAQTVPAGRWSNTDLTLTSSGGYGYGVADGGHRIGGFGFGVSDDEGRAVGGFGGVMNGQQVRVGGLTGSVNTWLGIGGLSLPEGSPSQFLAFFGEISAELGIALLPWFQVSGYVGMQAMGNLLPGSQLGSNTIYTPVTGIRATWGSF